MVFILVLILLAAAAGVLGAVLKVTLIVVLSLVLSVVVLTWLGVRYAKRRMRVFQRDVEVRLDQARRRREAYDLGDRSESRLEGRSLGPRPSRRPPRS